VTKARILLKQYKDLQEYKDQTRIIKGILGRAKVTEINDKRIIALVIKERNKQTVDEEILAFFIRCSNRIGLKSINYMYR
jgi:hypothetical protein